MKLRRVRLIRYGGRYHPYMPLFKFSHPFYKYFRPCGNCVYRVPLMPNYKFSISICDYTYQTRKDRLCRAPECYRKRVHYKERG